jgi:hypothetical protein
MTPKEYLAALENYNSNRPTPFVTGLCGRILRGRPNQTPDEFETLTDTPQSRIVIMLTDSNGLSQFFGKSDYQKCITVGHAPHHIESKVKAGYVYKLVVFPETSALLGTWDSVFNLCAEVYPDITNSIRQHSSEIVKLAKTGGNDPLVPFEKAAGYLFKDVDDANHPKFMDIDRYRKSSQGMLELRALLYHTLHLRELFRGDGFTYDESGRKGVKEYLMRNQPIATIPGHVLTPLNVVLPV